jgi:hypothetical protein
MKRYVFISVIVAITLLVTVYVASYFKTSRITTVRTSNGNTLTVRLMGQPWRNVNRPIGALETAVRGPDFGVAYEMSRQ